MEFKEREFYKVLSVLDACGGQYSVQRMTNGSMAVNTKHTVLTHRFLTHRLLVWFDTPLAGNGLIERLEHRKLPPSSCVLFLILYCPPMEMDLGPLSMHLDLKKKTLLSS